MATTSTKKHETNGRHGQARETVDELAKRLACQYPESPNMAIVKRMMGFGVKQNTAYEAIARVRRDLFGSSRVGEAVKVAPKIETPETVAAEPAPAPVPAEQTVSLAGLLATKQLVDRYGVEAVRGMIAALEQLK